MGYRKVDKGFKEIGDVMGEVFVLLNGYVEERNDEGVFEGFGGGCVGKGMGRW